MLPSSHPPSFACHSNAGCHFLAFIAWLLPSPKSQCFKWPGVFGRLLFFASLLFPLRLLALSAIYMLTTHGFTSPGRMLSMNSKSLSIYVDHATCLSDKHMKFNIHQLSCLLTSPPKKPNTKLGLFLSSPIWTHPGCCRHPSFRFLSHIPHIKSSEKYLECRTRERHTTSGATSLLQPPVVSCLSLCPL